MMKHSLLPALTLSLLVAGCAAGPSPEVPQGPPGELLGYVSYNSGTMHHPAIDVTKVTTNQLVAPDLQLTRVDDGFRGRTRYRSLDLHPNKDRVTGSRGGLPVELHIVHEDGLLVIRGLYGGTLMELRFPEAWDVAKGAVPVETLLPDDAAREELEAANGAPTKVKLDPSKVTIARMFAKLPEDEAVALVAAIFLR